NVRSYQKITIKNIYPGIDWVLFTNATSGIKYNFVIHPGADASQLKLQYKWTDKPELQSDGSIKINTPMGKITEGTPLSYTDENEQNRIETNYMIKNNEISFAINNYNKHKTLIIDPVLVWATYYGGNVGTEPASIQSDGTNVYVTGYETSIGFPTFNPGGGAYYQGTGNANYNAFVLQFNTSGVRKWATFYGGSSNDFGNSIFSDGTNVWVTGEARSTDFPTFNPGAGAYFQGTLVGISNAFVLQFTTSGVRKWATYYGGSVSDEGLSISSDGVNVWVTGITGSTNFPTFNPGGGAYYQGTLGSSGNAFILQFNTSGVRKWATYYGGSGGDIGNSISSDGTNVWVTGATSSTDFPTFNPGGGAFFQGTLIVSTSNAFVLQFTTSGVRKWATYYGGSVSDEGLSISSDGVNVWVTGQTTSTDFPTFNPGAGAYFQGTGSAYGAAFVLQFNTSGVRKWATYYGGSSFYGDNGTSIFSDGANVWVTGATSSTDFPTMNAGCNSYFQGTLGGGGEDVFLLQFSISGVRKWATFYGVDNENDGSYVSSDGTNVWLTGDAKIVNGYPTVNPGDGAYFENTNAGGDNLLLAQFKIVNTTTIIAIASPDSICLGDSSILKVSGGSNYLWHPSTELNSTTGTTVIAKPLTTTSYTVIGSDSCGGGIDSAKVTVYVKDCATPPTTGQIQIPNVITPNNDGKNDAFFITNLPALCKLKIFNRWGNTVYQTLSYQNNWEASDVVSGTYYYLLTLPDGTLKKGFLEVIK
ncbi:MAG: gliding motility-associated C-terminal domain-containing protein, partial [Bacteroidia bacterium]